MLRLSSTLRAQSSSIRAMAPTRALRTSAPRKAQDATSLAGYKEDPNAPAMLRYETSLPRLPVPPLSQTCERYLDSVRPHLSTAEFSTTANAVKSFMSSPLASELQKRLEARASEPEMVNWLADWWNDAAYMAYRDPVVVFVSYYYVHLDDRAVRSQAKRAAQLIKAMLPFRALVESGKLEPEKVKAAPLSMDSYKWLFHSSRYPTKPADTAQKFSLKENNHIVLIRKNKFFAVPLARPDGTELTAAEMEVQVERVIAQAGNDTAPAVGVLTSDNRDHWTDARADFLAASPSGLNAASLKSIESAMVLVPLDDFSPVTREDASWATWVGNGRNRFYDKHQLIVYENGKSGFLGEHSCMDGTPTLRMNDFMHSALAAGKIDLSPSRTSQTASDLPPPTELKFELDTKTHDNIKAAEARFDALVAEHALEVLHYEGYGKALIKTFKASPDAWAQLVKQLAFHRMHGRPGVCYESAQTRKYRLGRTEVIRSASNESREWAEAMDDPKRSDGEREALFLRAVKRHLTYAGWAADGQGVDRHLFGLKKMLKEGEQTPEIYTDAAFSRTNHWELSTSQLSSPFIDGWGYGEVVPDGYGLSYSIGDDYLRWSITSKKSDNGKELRTKELKHHLADAATDVRRMMERAKKAKEEGGKPKL